METITELPNTINSGLSEGLADEYLFGEGWGWAARHNAEIWGTGASGMYDAPALPSAKTAR